jgi:uncharacterized RDD family membrane protein YckC
MESSGRHRCRNRTRSVNAETEPAADPSLAPPPISSPGYAGFWRRFGAFAVDALLLGLFGYLIGTLFYDRLAELGFRGRIVGFLIALLYFAVFDSRIGRGRTPGKRMFGIRVVGSGGQPIGLLRAALRYCVLAPPLFLNGAPIPPDIVVSPSASQLLLALVASLAMFALGLSIVYLLIFNRPARRSLHDLLTGSYVLGRDAALQPAPPLRRMHVIALGVIVLLSLAVPFAIQRLAQTPALAAITHVQRAVGEEPGISEVGVALGTATGPGQQKTAPPLRVISITARSRAEKDFEALAARMVARALEAEPELKTLDSISVQTFYGFDIGIAHSKQLKTLQQTPLQWRNRIDAEALGEAPPTPP